MCLWQLGLNINFSVSFHVLLKKVLEFLKQDKQRIFLEYVCKSRVDHGLGGLLLIRLRGKEALSDYVSINNENALLISLEM